MRTDQPTNAIDAGREADAATHIHAFTCCGCDQKIPPGNEYWELGGAWHYGCWLLAQTGFREWLDCTIFELTNKSLDEYYDEWKREQRLYRGQR